MAWYLLQLHKNSCEESSFAKRQRLNFTAEISSVRSNHKPLICESPRTDWLYDQTSEVRHLCSEHKVWMGAGKFEHSEVVRKQWVMTIRDRWATWTKKRWRFQDRRITLQKGTRWPHSHLRTLKWIPVSCRERTHQPGRKLQFKWYSYSYN